MQAVQLQRQGALLSAILTACATLAMSWGWWCLMRGCPGLVRLRLSAGGLATLLGNEDAEDARLEACSLRLGRHVVLVLRTPRGLRRLLLGPGNLSPVEQAALGRWLNLAPRARNSAQGTTVD